MVWLIFIFNMKMKERKRNSWMTEMNKQIDWQQLHIRYEVEGKEKEIAEWEKTDKQIDWHCFHIRYEVEGKENK